MTALNRHTTTVVLYQGDDAAKIKELERAAHVAADVARRATLRMNDTGVAVLPLAQEHDDFVKEARGRAIVVEIQDIGRKNWRTLRQEHPARDDNDDDRVAGEVNADTFPDALLTYINHEVHDDQEISWRTLASITGPDTDQSPPTRAEMVEFLDSLNHGDFTRIYSEAYLLNSGAGVDPKASLVSALTPQNAETPK